MLRKKFLIVAANAIMLTSSSYALLSGLPALAKPDVEEPMGMVRSIPRSVAAGRGQRQVPYSIYLSPGYGVNLSFIPTGEIVQKVWFDNPSFATLDVDGCLEGLGQDCQQEGAQVLYLRGINPLNMPGLPESNSSLLTVVTNGSSGRSVYLFRVVAKSAETANPVYMIEVVPDGTTPSPNDER